MRKEVYIYETNSLAALQQLKSDEMHYTALDLLQHYQSDYDMYTNGKPYPLNTACMWQKHFIWWNNAIKAQNKMYDSLCLVRNTIKAAYTSTDINAEASKDVAILNYLLRELICCNTQCDIVSHDEVREFLLIYNIKPDFIKYNITKRTL